MKARSMCAGVLVATSLLTVTVCSAKEGSDNYPHGAENWQCGNVPPPGSYYINYAMYYQGLLRDGSGHKALLGNGTPSVWAVGEAARFLYVSHVRLLGGNYGAHLIVPIVHQSVDLAGRQSITSIGDFSMIPFALTFHSTSTHQFTAIDLDAPTGHVNTADPRVSVGSGSWTVMPRYGITAMSHSGWEYSGEFMYDFHLKDPLDNYKSGQEFHVDYLIGKHLKEISAGLGGYVLKQTTNDTIDGATVPAVAGMYSEGRKGQVLALGPSLEHITRGHLVLSCQYTHEALVRNRFGGDKFFFKVAMPLVGPAQR